MCGKSLFTDIQEDFEQAEYGRRIWCRLKEREHWTEKDCLIIFPTEHEQLNELAVKWMKGYIEKKHFEKVIVISYDSNLLSKVCGGNIIKEVMKKEDINHLLKYYRLQQFASNIVVASLESPYGNMHFVGHKGITLEDYVINAIYI